MWVVKSTKIFLIRLVLSFMFFSVFLCVVTAQADVPEIKSTPIIADVTTRSFSVIWVVNTTDADPNIHVYTDVGGTIEITPPTITVEQMPVDTGNSTQTPSDIRTAARLRGIQKIRVSGLNSNTNYYCRVYSTNSDGDSDSVPTPPDSPYSVQTEFQTIKTKIDGNDTCDQLTGYCTNNPTISCSNDDNCNIVPFSNDLMVVELYDETGADLNGGIVLAKFSGLGNYPVSTFVGAGIAPPNAMIDLNNVFGGASHKNLEIIEGDRMDLLIVRGSTCPEEQLKYRRVPQNNNLTESKLITACYDYTSDPKWIDVDCSCFISMSDVQKVLNHLAAVFGSCEYNKDYDVNISDFISMADVQPVLDQLGQTCE